MFGLEVERRSVADASASDWPDVNSVEFQLFDEGIALIYVFAVKGLESAEGSSCFDKVRFSFLHLEHLAM